MTQPTLTHDGGNVCEHGVDITLFVCTICGNTPTDTISTTQDECPDCWHATVERDGSVICDNCGWWRDK